jgi:hypothetical protein
MGEHLHEGVLHGLVGIVRIPQIVIGDAERPSLLPADQLGKAIAGGIPFAGDHQRLDGGGQLRIT